MGQHANHCNTWAQRAYPRYERMKARGLRCCPICCPKNDAVPSSAPKTITPHTLPQELEEDLAMSETLTKAKIEKFISTGVPAGKTQTIKWDGMVRA